MRATLGWERMRLAEPNAGHFALAALERDGAVRHVITQNVDGLHRKAGSRNVTELHGALAEVACLSATVTGQLPQVRRLLADARQATADLDRSLQPRFSVPRASSLGEMVDWWIMALEADIWYWNEADGWWRTRRERLDPQLQTNPLI